MKRKRTFKGGKRRATLEAAEQVRAGRREAGKLSKYAEKKVRLERVHDANGNRILIISEKQAEQLRKDPAWVPVDSKKIKLPGATPPEPPDPQSVVSRMAGP